MVLDSCLVLILGSVGTSSVRVDNAHLLEFLGSRAAAAEQIPRPYERAEENARSLHGHFGMTRRLG